MKKQQMLKFLLLISVLLTLAIYLLPLLWLFISSFKSATDIFTVNLRILFRPTLENYRVVINSVLPRKILNSALISIAAVCLTLTSGLLAAYGLSRFRFRARDNVFFLLLVTALTPPVVTSVPLFIMYRHVGLLDTHVGLILVYTFSNIGFCTWILRGFLEDVPREIEEAAFVDGCGPWKTLFYITIPIIRGGIITTAILIFIFNWNEFLFASILTRTRAATFTTHLVTYLGSRRVLWGELCAASVLGVLPPLLLAMSIRRFLIRGLTFGVVKG